MPGAMKPGSPALANSATSVRVAPIPDKSITDRSVPDKSSSGKPASIADVAQEQQVKSFDELPVQIQREIPEMTVQLHAYSSNPGERLVYINGNRMQEGETVTPGLRLDEITPDGMIFNYKGYRFKRGIR